MKRRHKNRPRPLRVLRLWTWPQAHKALPFLRSVLGSLRDHWLRLQGTNLDLRRLSQAPGRPNRDMLIDQGRLENTKMEAECQFEDALGELLGIDVYLLDPVRGLAFIPFAQEDRLAWFVFDLFDPEGVSTWRFHEDPLELRRPLAEVLTPKPTAA